MPKPLVDIGGKQILWHSVKTYEAHAPLQGAAATASWASRPGGFLGWHGHVPRLDRAEPGSAEVHDRLGYEEPFGVVRPGLDSA